MQFVCRTCSAVQSVVPERESICASCGAALLTPEPTVSDHVWYTSGATGQGGPFDALQLARMFDRGALTWTDEVWRDGLRDWRPARKDDVLVVEVASARGLDAATLPLNTLPSLLTSQSDSGEEPAFPRDDTRTDPIPAGHITSPGETRAYSSRGRMVASGFRLATYALAAFIGGGLIVSLMGRLSGSGPQARVAASPLPATSASMVTTAPVTSVRPSSGELVKRTLPARDEILAELLRLSASARRCARDPKAGLELELTIAGASGRPRQIDVRTPRMTPGMIECTKAALQELRIAPFTSDELTYSHHYTW